MGPCVHTESPGQGWVSLSPLPSEIPSQTCHLSPLYRRIGRKASILIQLLLFAIIGLATAFVPTFELYMVMRFAVATAVAGYALTNVTLREYLACGLSHRVRPWGLASFPDCLRGPCQGPHLQGSPLCFLGWD